MSVQLRRKALTFVAATCVLAVVAVGVSRAEKSLDEMTTDITQLYNEI